MKDKGIFHEEAGLEDVLLAAEAELGVGLTVHDITGAFADAAGRPLLERDRQSHQRYQACHVGFGQRCLEHCRYDINTRLAQTHSVETPVCWKGLREIVVPLVSGEQFLGTLFAGPWRAGDPPPTEETCLPARWSKLFKALPPFPDPKRVARLQLLLRAVADGLVQRLERLHRQRRTSRTHEVEISEFLRRECVHPLQLSDLARRLHLSSSRTGHLVSELFGKPFRVLLLEHRVNRAKVLLMGTSYPVWEVATRVGFGDAYYFSRAFKKLTGVSPLRFRQQPREF